MTTPNLSEVILYTPAELRSDAGVSKQVISLINDAFGRSKLADPHKWDAERPRFPTIEEYYKMLDENSMVALVFDRDASLSIGISARDGNTDIARTKELGAQGKVVGCAAAVPWKGGWAKEGAGTEDGFEIKATCVDGNEKYIGKGLNLQMMEALTTELIQKSKSRGSSQACAPAPGNPGDNPLRATLTLWILAADCINGVYWRKRGYREVRRKTEGQGTWGCKTEFDMIVLRKDVAFDLSP